MLVFCEDCGGKNIIDPERLNEENKHYRCTLCNFLNTNIPQSSLVPDDLPHKSQTNPPPQTKIAKRSSNKGPKRSSKTRVAPSSKRHTLNAHQDPYCRIFKKFAAQTDIIGAYVYHFSDGLITYDTDRQMSEETMRQIGKAFSVCNPFGHKILSRTKEVYLVLNDQVAVCRNITTNSILVLLCHEYPASPEISSLFDQSINSLQVFI